jgi:hypothetical protein
VAWRHSGRHRLSRSSPRYRLDSFYVPTLDAVAFWPPSARRGGRVVWRPAGGCAAGVPVRPAEPSARHGLVVSQAGGRREFRGHYWPGAGQPLLRDLARDGPGLAGERVHGGRAAQARLWGLLGPARERFGGVGGHIWSARGRAPCHLVLRPPRRPWRVALTPGGGVSTQGSSFLAIPGCEMESSGSTVPIPGWAEWACGAGRVATLARPRRGEEGDTGTKRCCVVRGK